MNVYKWTITARCPTKKMRDFYTAELRLSAGMIPVESLMDISEKFVMEEIFQEHLEQKLRKEVEGLFGTTPIELTLTGNHFGIDVSSG